MRQDFAGGSPRAHLHRSMSQFQGNRRQWLAGAGTSLFAAGCWRPAEREVVAYTALDREFSEPVLEQFGKTTGIRVAPLFDVESTKTVGLYNRIVSERERPQCDVFWNNEVLHTIQLQQAGLLQSYVSPASAPFPGDMKDPEGFWVGLAARGRVLLVNDQLVGERGPSGLADLVDPQWKNRCAVAKPLFGTTKTHAAMLFVAWGPERASEYFKQLAENAVVLSGNKQVALAVAQGRMAFGLTDTDDAIIERDQGAPVSIVFPDQAPEGVGCLRIPNSLCIIHNAPHPREARQLIDFLLRPEVEAALAEGPSAQFPINPNVGQRPRLELPETLRWMPADFAAAAKEWGHCGEFLAELFHSA